MLSAGKVYVHEISPGSGVNESSSGGGEVLLLPPAESLHSSNSITQISFGGDFFFYGTDAGEVHAFSLSTLTTLPNHLSLGPEIIITLLSSNSLGTRVVVMDSLGRTLLFNPVAGTAILVPLASTPGMGTLGSGACVQWDSEDRHVFTVCTPSGAAPSIQEASTLAPPASGSGSGGLGNPSNSPQKKVSSSSNHATTSKGSHEIFSVNAFIHTPHSLTGPRVTPLGAASLGDDGALIINSAPAHSPRGKCLSLRVRVRARALRQ